MSTKIKKAYLALIVVQILFGLNFISSKVVLQAIGPMALASFRFVLAGLFLLIFALMTKNKFKLNCSWPKFLISIMLFSSLGISLSQTLFLNGLALTTASNTAILATTIPIFGVVVSWFRGQSFYRHTKGLGIIVAFAGVLILKRAEQFELSYASIVGDLNVIGGCALIGWSISYSQNIMKQTTPLWGSIFMFILGGLFLLPFSYSEVAILIDSLSSTIITLNFLYCVLGATLLTYFLNNWLVQIISPEKISLFIFLQPITAGFFGYILFEEVVGIRELLSIAIVMTGIYLTIKSPRQARPDSFI